MIDMIAAVLCLLAPAGFAASLQQNAPATPPSAAAPLNDLKEYSYPSDGFAFSAPSQPMLSTQGASGEIRKYKVDLRRNVGFVVTVFDSKAAESMSAKEALAAAMDRSARDFSAKITAEKEIPLDGQAGLQYEAASEMLHLRGRVFVVQGRVFAITMVAPGNFPFPPVAGQMLDSFKFLKPAAPAGQ